MPVIPVYAREEMPADGICSIFLAGPTPRAPKDGADPVPSWRPEALRILQELGYDGHVFVPEPRDGEWLRDYDGQVKWEEEALHRADVILFWIPREMKTMPALTTNDEWGFWKESGKVVLGCPEDAVHTRYQEFYAAEYGIPTSRTLDETLINAMIRLNKLGPVLRRGGELTVPLHIWHTPTFQAWLGNLHIAGNYLMNSRVLRTFYQGPKRVLFGYVLWADVLVAAEGRHRTNEFFVARPDISAIVLHGPVNPQDVLATEVVLVKEFRTPVNNPTGYVWGLAGGSSRNPNKDPREVASEEVREETGLVIDPSRFEFLRTRQMVATLSVHRAHAFRAALTPEEIASVKATSTEARGVVEDTERTYTVVQTLGEILGGDHVDWSMVGMIFSALQDAI